MSTQMHAAGRRFPTPRQLGYNRPLRDDEWLQSALTSLAWDMGVSRQGLFRFMGLSGMPSQEADRLGTVVERDVAENISAATGWEISRIEAATMSATNMVPLTRVGNIQPLEDWARASGTRYCPRCLDADPGVFRLTWRLIWSFVCIEHRQLLHDSCPECRRPLVDVRSRGPRLVDITRCQSRDGEAGRGAICGFPLADAWDELPVSRSSPLLNAQKQILTALGKPGVGLLAGTLRGNSIALLRAEAFDVIADLSGVSESQTTGLFPVGDRIGTTAPDDALAMGAVTTAALHLAFADEQVVRPLIRRISFQRPVGHVPVSGGGTIGSPAGLLRSWPGVALGMERRVLRAVDADMTPMQRLYVGSALQQRERGGETWDARPSPLRDMFNHGVPRSFWPSWSQAFDDGQRREPIAHNFALHLAAQVADSDWSLARRDVESGADRPSWGPYTGVDIRRFIRPLLKGNSDRHVERLIRGLCLLVQKLRLSRPPIDYSDRIRRIWKVPLYMVDWASIAAAAHRSPGDDGRRVTARRFMVLRATGMRADELPRHIAFRPRTSDSAKLTAFIANLDTELLGAIDDYLIPFVRQRSWYGQEDSAEPVWWEPDYIEGEIEPVDRSPLDIDIDRLHELLNGGLRAVAKIAAELHRTPRHVSIAIARWPRAGRAPRERIDWSQRFIDLGESHTRAWLRGNGNDPWTTPDRGDKADVGGASQVIAIPAMNRRTTIEEGR